MNRLYSLAVLSAALLLPGCDRAAEGLPGQEALSVEQAAVPVDPDAPESIVLESLGRSAEDITLSLKRARSMPSDAITVGLACDLWNGERAVYPEANWSALAALSVRVELANWIIQAARGGYLVRKERLEAIALLRKVVDQHITHRGVLGEAVVSLGLNDDPEDVPRIVAAGRLGQYSLKSDTVLALGLMCSLQARTALREFLDSADTGEQERLRSLASQVEASRIRSGECSGVNPEPYLQPARGAARARYGSPDSVTGPDDGGRR